VKLSDINGLTSPTFFALTNFLAFGFFTVFFIAIASSSWNGVARFPESFFYCLNVKEGEGSPPSLKGFTSLILFALASFFVLGFSPSS
jgi:hypothetical protein